MLEAQRRSGASQRLREVWRPRALRLLGREAELTREDVLGLRLEQRLAGLQAEIERARAAGDDDAAQMAHARYIELGTSYAPVGSLLVERVAGFVAEHGVLEPGEPVVALVSGGADSLCLWGVLRELGHPRRGAARRARPARRGRASPTRRSAPASAPRVVPLDLEGGAERRGARPRGPLRGRPRARRRAGSIATGHTLTDQAETVVYRLA